MWRKVERHLFFTLCTRWRVVIGFLYLRIRPEETTCFSHYTGGWVGLRPPWRGSKEKNICLSRELNPSQLASIHLLVIHLSRVLSEKSAFVVELHSVRWQYADTNIYMYWTVRDRMPVGARFSAPVQTGPRAQPASYTMGTVSFLGVKRPGRGVDYPSPYSAEVKGSVELCLYFTSGPSWLVLGWN